MKRILCAMAWLGICAALVGCTTSAIEGPETVSHHVDPSSSVSDPASSEDPGAYDGEFSLSVGEGALPAAPEEIVIQIHNGTDEEFSYGEAYWLERLSDSGKWEMLEYLPDTAWHDIGILSAPHSQSEHRIHPVNYYGKEALTQGHYRYGNTFNAVSYTHLTLPTKA